MITCFFIAPIAFGEKMGNSSQDVRQYWAKWAHTHSQKETEGRIGRPKRPEVHWQQAIDSQAPNSGMPRPADAPGSFFVHTPRRLVQKSGQRRWSADTLVQTCFPNPMDYQNDSDTPVHSSIAHYAGYSGDNGKQTWPFETNRDAGGYCK